MTVTLEIGEDEVEEGVAVPVCVSLSNVIERDVVVELTTSSGNFPNPASGNYYDRKERGALFYPHTETRDFVMLNQALTFQTNDRYCEDLELIIDDSVLEDSETFQISVSTSDPNVTLSDTPNVSIAILDDDSMQYPLLYKDDVLISG